jgi:putative component of membrane protein insertase Oxa1/YidC/SpoIIIJ protein YidD
MSELLTIQNRRSKYRVRFAVWVIRNVWQKRLSRRYSARMQIRCRFYPGCSEYAIQSFEKFGIFRGAKKSVNRIKRCNLDNTDSCVDFP